MPVGFLSDRVGTDSVTGCEGGGNRLELPPLCGSEPPVRPMFEKGVQMSKRGFQMKRMAGVSVLTVAACLLVPPAAAQSSYANQRRMEAEQRRHAEQMLREQLEQQANQPPQPRYRVREEPDIAGELMEFRKIELGARMQAVVAVAVHTESGAYGAAVGDGLSDRGQTERRALSSCMAKVSGRSYDSVLNAKPREIERLLADTRCMVFRVNPQMNSVNLFRTRLPGNGGYRFYQADSPGLVVPPARHNEAKQRCENEGSGCRLLLQLGVGEHGQVF